MPTSVDPAPVRVPVVQTMRLASPAASPGPARARGQHACVFALKRLEENANVRTVPAHQGQETTLIAPPVVSAEFLQGELTASFWADLRCQILEASADLGRYHAGASGRCRRDSNAVFICGHPFRLQPTAPVRPRALRCPRSRLLWQRGPAHYRPRGRGWNAAR